MSGVATKPGDTQLTRTSGAASMAADWVKLISPALAAEYGASPSVGRTPDAEATLTTAPPRRAGPPRAAGPLDAPVPGLAWR